MKSYPKLQESNLEYRILFQNEKFSIKAVDLTASRSYPIDYLVGDVKGGCILAKCLKQTQAAGKNGGNFAKQKRDN